MNKSALSVLAFFAVAPSMPTAACGCIETSPEVKKWVSCSFGVAKKNRQSKFYENYLIARRDDLKLLSTTPKRFSALETKIVKTCGPYEKARQRDLKAGYHEGNAPDNFVDAVWN
jgi:hypothetical protein